MIYSILVILIPHHNTPDLLQRLIDSIPQREDIEIIVVDDNHVNVKPEFKRKLIMEDRKVYVIILAGGIGNRLGAGIPKQFVEILGKPVIAYTMEHFQNHPQVDAIELVCVDGFFPQLQKIVNENGITKVIQIVKGGSEYERSIMNGIKGLEGIAKSEDIVMIHWAASPFVTEDVISDNLRVCMEKGNAISASYSYLLYGTNDGDCSKRAINRESFMTLAAPQSFQFKVISDIYRQVEEKKMFDYCEAHTTAFMTELGIPIYFSKGSHSNIKITTKEDLDLFRGYLLNKKYPTE